MKPIRTERLILRNWEERDRDLFHRINSDDRVMEFFPFRRDRAESDALHGPAARRDRGATATALPPPRSPRPANASASSGCIRAEIEPVVPAGTIEIGWRLAPEYWGKGYVTEAAAGLARLRLRDAGLDEIVSFAVWNNHRSTAVMRRHRHAARSVGDFDHPRVPDTHPRAEAARHLPSQKRQMAACQILRPPRAVGFDGVGRCASLRQGLRQGSCCFWVSLRPTGSMSDEARVEGRYCGRAWSGGELVEIVTTLDEQPDGRIGGSYEFADRGDLIPGTLREYWNLPGGTRTLVWTDKYGMGRWSWNSTRSPNPSPANGA